MIIENVIYNKLNFFSDENRVYIKNLISNKICELSADDTYIFLKIWKSVDDDTTEFQKDVLIDLLERLYIKSNQPIFHIANEGENIVIDIKLDINEDDFTGSILLARNAEDFTALSDETQAGNDDEMQTVTLVDLNLTGEDFYEVVILTEVPDGSGSASGDVHAVINRVYLYVDINIDSDV